MNKEAENLVACVIKIANHEIIKILCEPNIMWHEDIKEHQVMRVLYAYNLFREVADENLRVRKLRKKKGTNGKAV